MRSARSRAGQGLDQVVAGLGLVVFFLLLWVGLTDVQRVADLKQHAVQAVLAAEREAVVAASADPDLAQGQSALNPTIAQQIFTQQLPSVLQWPAGTYQIQSVQLFTAAQTGQALPAPMVGTVPGPGLYAVVTFQIDLVPFGNPADRTGYTVPVTVGVWEPANRFNQPQIQWAPG